MTIQTKTVKVLHNPGAGEGETSKKELIREIKSAGFKCSYSSTKRFRWESIEAADFDFLVLAGGDGTVRKIAEELLERKVIQRSLPIGLLPMGTANNIAKTLGVCGEQAYLIESWHQAKARKFDVGKIEGLKEAAFFLESFGYGVFPKLMYQMKKQKKNGIEDPKEKLQVALELLRDLVAETRVQKCELEINGKDYSGDFLLIEVMNIRSIGPNLNLARDADPGDGQFDVVFIMEKQRKALAEYIQNKIDGLEVPFDFPALKTDALKINWGGKHFHVDDEYYKLDEPVAVNIELREGLLEFLVPDEKR